MFPQSRPETYQSSKEFFEPQNIYQFKSEAVGEQSLNGEKEFAA